MEHTNQDDVFYVEVLLVMLHCEQVSTPAEYCQSELRELGH